MSFARLIIFSLVLTMVALPVLAHNMGPPTAANIEIKTDYTNETTSFDGTTGFAADLIQVAGATLGMNGTRANYEPPAVTPYFLYTYYEDAEIAATARNGTRYEPSSRYAAAPTQRDPGSSSANDVRRRDFLQVTGRLVIWEL